jgi:hypothetical protein
MVLGQLVVDVNHGSWRVAYRLRSGCVWVAGCGL